MKYKDYYEILGVEKSAGQDEIKKAYKKLARKYHPDVSKISDAEARFKEVGEAYEVLKDPKKRKAYDQLGSNWNANQDFQPPPGWQRQYDFANGAGEQFEFDGESPFSDFFESLFGGGEGSSRFSHGFGHGNPFEGHGQDIHAEIEITVEDAYHGVTPTITLSRAGKPQALKVRIPKGVKPGQQIRLKGQGAPGSQGKSNGDLYLGIQFRPHSVYTVSEKDVFVTLPIAPWEAALGAKVEVPTPDGKVGLTIPAGCGSGRKLRLKGKGIPAAEPGDLYVVLQVVLPPADSEQAKALYRQMEQTLAFDPRKHLSEAKQ